MMPPAPWEIRDVELRDGPPALAATCANAVFVIFRVDGVVLGTSYLLASDLPLGGEEVAAIAAPRIAGAAHALLTSGPRAVADAAPYPGRARVLVETLPPVVPSTLDALISLIRARRAAVPDLTVSIVVCTRHRVDMLASCLAGLARELARGRELIVVDNGPDEATRLVVASLPGARYVMEDRPGLSRARNAGLKAATGAVIVFIDDDVRPEPGWIDALLVGFCDPDVALVTGLVLPAELRAPAQIAFELGLGFGGMGLVPLHFDRTYVRGTRRFGLPVWEFGAGANMALRREATVRVGGFDERLGPGAAGGCGEDSEYWYRLVTAGYTARYEPFAVVRHRHRADAAALRRQTVSYMHGHVAALLVQFSRHRHWGNLRRLLFSLPRHFGRRLVGQLKRSFAGDFDDLLLPMLWGYTKGLADLHLLRAVPPPRIGGESDG
jgi:GT2 family glycosyltransferase